MTPASPRSRPLTPRVRAGLREARTLAERTRALADELGEEAEPNATDHALAVEACAFAAQQLGVAPPRVRWFRGDRALRGYAAGGVVYMNVAHGAAATSTTEMVETVCHETLHVAEPHRSHDDIARLAKRIAKRFWEDRAEKPRKGPERVIGVDYCIPARW